MCPYLQNDKGIRVLYSVIITVAWITNFDTVLQSSYQECVLKLQKKTNAIDWNLNLALDYSDITRNHLI